MRFTHALVRPPGANYVAALTSADLGPPDLLLAQQQHEAYGQALEKCGVTVTRLAPDLLHPDSTFVEDAAIVTTQGALLTRPGALSRRGEVETLRPDLLKHLPILAEIQAPGTLDGGDVCDADGHFFIGLSARTNEDGAWQLARWLEKLGLSSTLVDLRAKPGLLHLKSGLAYVGNKTLAAVEALANEKVFFDFQIIRVPAGEDYVANCLLVNDTLLIAQGFPNFAEQARKHCGRVLELGLTEFRKMDGGLSCLSLRW